MPLNNLSEVDGVPCHLMVRVRVCAETVHKDHILFVFYAATVQGHIRSYAATVQDKVLSVVYAATVQD